MPRISAFYGIVVYMYYRDHAPPHVHAFYGSDEAAFAIADGSMIAGHLPRRASALVEEWIAARRAELLADWTLAGQSQPLVHVPPLD